MSDYVPNKYPNIFGCHTFTEKYLNIFVHRKYSYSSMIKEIFEKDSFMLPLKKCYTGYFVCINFI